MNSIVLGITVHRLPRLLCISRKRRYKFNFKSREHWKSQILQIQTCLKKLYFSRTSPDADPQKNKNKTKQRQKKKKKKGTGNLRIGFKDMKATFYNGISKQEKKKKTKTITIKQKTRSVDVLGLTYLRFPPSSLIG